MPCLCFDGTPVPEDPRAQFVGRQWETSMMDSCCNNPPGCLLALFCPPCFAFVLRRRALQGDMTRYKCCQGYICPTCCDGVGETAPDLCLCLEAFFCESCAISSTRMFVQDERQIQTDPCDNRIIRFNNLIQMLACICECLAMFCSSFRTCAQLLRCIADIVYCITQACMQAQTDHELALHATAQDYGAVVVKAPAYQTF